jgi:hypothetical protein
MWDLLEHYASNEQNPSVINDALQALRRLPVAHATRTAALTIRVLNRTTHGASQHDVHEGCVNILCALTLWANEPQSTAAIDHLIADPSTHARDIQRLIMDLAGTIPAKDPTVTVRAFALLHRTLDSVITAMRAIDAQYQGVAWPPDAQEIYRGLFQAADEAAQRLYFASGAFKNSDKERVLLARDVFYLHARPLFVLLAEIGHPHTAHNLLETLKYFVRVDPAGILQLVSATVKMGSKYGYQYEPLAEGLMVDIVEQYLAEYRPLFRDHPECHTALMTILDVFVRVGWPRAHQLTYQLGDIYR